MLTYGEVRKIISKAEEEIEEQVSIRLEEKYKEHTQKELE